MFVLVACEMARAVTLSALDGCCDNRSKDSTSHLMDSNRLRDICGRKTRYRSRECLTERPQGSWECSSVDSSSSSSSSSSSASTSTSSSSSSGSGSGDGSTMGRNAITNHNCNSRSQVAGRFRIGNEEGLEQSISRFHCMQKLLSGSALKIRGGNRSKDRTDNQGKEEYISKQNLKERGDAAVGGSGQTESKDVEEDGGGQLPATRLHAKKKYTLFAQIFRLRFVTTLIRK